MKLSLVSAAFPLCFAVATFGQAALAQSFRDGPVVMPVLQNAPITSIFVPVGFDDNDSVEVIVHGHFKNSCHKIGPVVGYVDEDTQVITVKAKAFAYQANECVDMEIPFVQTIKLGQLAAARYTVVTDAAAGLQPKILDVTPALTSTADDNLYAPVDSVSFLPVEGMPGSYTLTVSGIFPRSESGCLFMKELKVLPFADSLVVLPIARFEGNVSACPSSSSAFDRDFSATQIVNLDLTVDLLIHVRVLNGDSVNKVIEVEN